MNDHPDLIAAFVAAKGILERGKIPKHLRSMIPRYQEAGAPPKAIGMFLGDLENLMCMIRGIESEVKSLKAEMRTREISFSMGLSK